jgi:hypothetical protein
VVIVLIIIADDSSVVKKNSTLERILRNSAKCGEKNIFLLKNKGAIESKLLVEGGMIMVNQ